MYCRTLLSALALIFMTSAACAMPFEEAIRSIDPQGRYFFYLHGAIMEEQGKNASNQRYGAYKYDSIIKHFEDRGLIVIDEVRSKTNPAQYASKITQQIRRLIAAGVPASGITVAGFSKGGHIALLVASSLGDPNVRYVIMAGCGRGRTSISFDRFLKAKRGARLKGHIYSIYASSDLEAGSCSPAINQSDGQGLTFHENPVKTGKGHGLFFQPRPEWIEPVTNFAKGGR